MNLPTAPAPSRPASAPAPAPAAPRYWIDGALVSAREATLPLTDLAITRGYGAFDALRTYHGTPFLLDQHLARLERTCDLLFLRLPRTRQEIRDIVHATVAANALPDVLIRIYVTGGDASGFVPENRERLLVLVDPLRAYPAKLFEEGVGLATSKLERTLPLAKSTCYLAGVWETIQAKRNGLDEAVFCDATGDILEGTTFNVAAILGRELVTPLDGLLPGTTIEHLMQIAAREGLKVRRAPISPAMIQHADEVFITSSTREIIPVNRIDGTKIRNAPGPITRKLHAAYRASVESICRVASKA